MKFEPAKSNELKIHIEFILSMIHEWRWSAWRRDARCPGFQKPNKLAHSQDTFRDTYNRDNDVSIDWQQEYRVPLFHYFITVDERKKKKIRVKYLFRELNLYRISSKSVIDTSVTSSVKRPIYIYTSMNSKHKCLDTFLIWHVGFRAHPRREWYVDANSYEKKKKNKTICFHCWRGNSRRFAIVKSRFTNL